MEIKRVILARILNVDVDPTNAIPWQLDVRFSKKDFFCWEILSYKSTC